MAINFLASINMNPNIEHHMRISFVILYTSTASYFIVVMKILPEFCLKGAIVYDGWVRATSQTPA